jgi:hypothetical protein
MFAYFDPFFEKDLAMPSCQSWTKILSAATCPKMKKIHGLGGESGTWTSLADGVDVNECTSQDSHNSSVASSHVNQDDRQIPSCIKIFFKHR